MFCAKTRGAKNILKNLGSRLVSGKFHENKVFAVMEMASDPSCFWRHFFPRALPPVIYSTQWVKLLKFKTCLSLYFIRFHCRQMPLFNFTI